MESSNYGIHEIIDFRELVNFKAACLIQSKSRVNEVENPELKNIVEKNIEQGRVTVSQMMELLNSAATQMKQ